VTAATDKIETERSPEVLRLHETGVKPWPWTLAVGVSLYAGLVCLLFQFAQVGTNDFSYFHVAARALWLGQNPYAAVEALGSYPLFYPGPALVVLLPFGLLPERAAWLAFALVSGAAFGLAALRRPELRPAVLSACFVEAIGYGQWPPLLVAGAVIPALGFLFATKPSVGLALFAWRPAWSAVAGGVGITVVSLALAPTWPWDWLHALERTNHVAPVLRPWGWILLLAALRWRTPEGRLLLVLALVPQTTALHGALPLFLLCRGKREAYVLAGLSFVVAFGQGMVGRTGTLEGDLAARWPVLFAGLWLPALYLSLRPAATSGRGYWSRGWGTTRRAAPVAT
jgi:hypothetical protein